MTFYIQLLILRLEYGLRVRIFLIFLTLFYTFENIWTWDNIIQDYTVHVKPPKCPKVHVKYWSKPISEISLRAQNQKLGRECEVRIFIWTRGSKPFFYPHRLFTPLQHTHLLASELARRLKLNQLHQNKKEIKPQQLIYHTPTYCT